jgi:Phosphotransferase enzyme family
MLTVDTVTPFLLGLGLIDRKWIVDGTLTVYDAARRNRNLWIEGPDGTGLFLKQPDESAERGHATLRQEAVFYRLCRELPALGEVMHFLPHMIHEDSPTATLVLELVPNAVSIRTLIQDHDGQDTAVRASRAIGRTMGAIHRTFRAMDLEHDPRFSQLGRNLPWALTIDQPKTEMLAYLSAANFETLRVIQAELGSINYLGALRSQWEAKTVIHGDIKLDHFLISSSRRTRDEADAPAWIVDWEMVGIGDPAWDLAGALHDFLVNWVLSMPLSESMSADDMFRQAKFSLADSRKLSQATWSGYRDGANLAGADADRLLLRAVKYSAARLIQSAFEIAQEADRLPGHAVILLQLSANLLAEPERGQIQLYGISVGSIAS